MDPNSPLLSPPPQACSYLADPCMEGGRSPSPQDSPFPWNQVPSSNLTDPDWFWDEHTQAKRARVETIIRGMCLSPNLLVSGDAQTRDRSCSPEKARERKRKQRLPMQQGRLQPVPAGDQSSRKGSPRVREQLHLLKQQLRHLQEHILQAAEPRDIAQGPGEPEKGKHPRNIKQRHGYGSRPWAMDSDDHQGSRGNFPRAGELIVSEVESQSEEPSFLPSGAQTLLDILSKELTGVVCQAIDSVLQKVLLDPPGHLTHLGRSFQGLGSEGRSESSPPDGDAYKDPLPLATFPRRAQSQAGGPLGNLSLATSLESPRYPISPRMIPKPYQGPPANCPLPSHIQENQMLSQLLGHGPKRHWNSSLPRDSPSQGHPCSESALPLRGAVKLRPSVLSQQQCPLPFTCTSVESRSLLPSVKMEQGSRQGVADALPFSSVHEALNPGHLKKAKLMFFFTRYPSSSLLKAYFPDVQFNRCITSQMIKWFSNFREFYYIQMEKFARQAISDGVTNPKTLVVLRDSELFRALNMHYNKGNDFEILSGNNEKQYSSVPIHGDLYGRHTGVTLEVPDCFLEIASLTLQEFFRAVSTGKDSDPSWKKPIYKIISKLDSVVPEIFKSSSYPPELFRN